MVTGLKFRILKVGGLYYPCSENKGADQLHGYREADLRLCFRICKKPVFSLHGSIEIIEILKAGIFLTRRRLFIGHETAADANDYLRDLQHRLQKVLSNSLRLVFGNNMGLERI